MIPLTWCPDTVVEVQGAVVDKLNRVEVVEADFSSLMGLLACGGSLRRQKMLRDILAKFLLGRFPQIKPVTM